VRPPALALLALLAGLAIAAPARAQLGPNGTRAYDMARGADDAARAAQDEGVETLTQLHALKAGSRDADALKALQEQAEAAAEALAGYRKQVQASADETFERLAEVARGPREDPARREQLEQRALLAAYEAAVMAARARSQAERLRALHADARALLAGSAGAPGGMAARSPSRPAPPAEPAPAAGAAGQEALVPNLVGARLDAAAQELAAAGLRLGPTAGPREGFVVKQTPPAGARVPRQAAVSLTLSATAAGVTVLPPR